MNLLTEIYKVSLDDLVGGPSKVKECENQIITKYTKMEDNHVTLDEENDFPIQKDSIRDKIFNESFHKDLSITLLVILVISALVPFLGLILVIIVLKKNNKNNSVYTLIKLGAIFCLLLNLNNAVLIINDIHIKSGITNIEKID